MRAQSGSGSVAHPSRSMNTRSSVRTSPIPSKPPALYALTTSSNVLQVAGSSVCARVPSGWCGTFSRILPLTSALRWSTHARSHGKTNIFKIWADHFAAAATRRRWRHAALRRLSTARAGHLRRVAGGCRPPGHNGDLEQMAPRRAQLRVKFVYRCARVRSSILHSRPALGLLAWRQVRLVGKEGAGANWYRWWWA